MESTAHCQPNPRPGRGHRCIRTRQRQAQPGPEPVFPVALAGAGARHPVSHMAALFGDSVPIFDIRKAAGMTDMLVRDAARGRALAQALAGRPAVLMRGHGVTVVGPSLPFAVGRSIYLELNARVQLQAMGLGGPVTYLDPAEAQKVLDSGENRSYERPWELWKRQVQGK